ncbi:MAG: hypothetical protein K6D93_00105 [Saccharofermentans sp.]|nr:hypothetical protein [Saccharofermentans sp.]
METDDSRKLMVCRSCGNVYDYDYFCAENLLKAADKALAHKNYSAAKDMYMFMLDKEPSNVKALKGFLLAKNNVNRFYDITKQIREGSFVISAFNLEKYRNESDPEASRFFEKTDRVMALYKYYLALKKSLKNLERKAAGSEPGDTDYGGGLLYYSSAGTLKKIVLFSSIAVVIFGIAAFMLGSDPYAPGWLISAMVFAMIVTCFFIFAALLELLDRKKKEKKHVLSETDEINAGMKEKKGEMDKILNEINDVLKEMNT